MPRKLTAAQCRKVWTQKLRKIVQADEATRRRAGSPLMTARFRKMVEDGIKATAAQRCASED